MFNSHFYDWLATPKVGTASWRISHRGFAFGAPPRGTLRTCDVEA